MFIFYEFRPFCIDNARVIYRKRRYFYYYYFSLYLLKSQVWSAFWTYCTKLWHLRLPPQSLVLARQQSGSGCWEKDGKLHASIPVRSSKLATLVYFVYNVISPRKECNQDSTNIQSTHKTASFRVQKWGTIIGMYLVESSLIHYTYLLTYSMEQGPSWEAS